MTEFFTERLRHFNDKHLTFSCYRIRRCWSLPLPLTALPELALQIRGFAQPYPWQIWCLWALEERIYTLAGAATFSGDQVARTQCIESLESLSAWPRYRVADRLDLPYGHAVQLMAIALRDWHWLPHQTQQALRTGLQRAVEEGMKFLPSAIQAVTSAEALLSLPNPHQYLHNIPLIAQAALATAAKVIDHPQCEIIASCFLHQFQARLALSLDGLTEGISYDGYLYNFALAWLESQPDSVISTIVNHPAMLDLEHQARGLACPGKVVLSAEIGDVEPLDMPFVWSALARLQQWNFSASRQALLKAVPPENLRSDALCVLARLEQQRVGAVYGSQAVATDLELAVLPVQQSTAALTLASGLKVDDLSVVMSLCTSPMNHIQADTGSLLIGHAGHWWITDPGYQQYLKTSERDFTLGPQAHNTPVINGYAQSHKAGKLLHKGSYCTAEHIECAYAVVDLTACYPAAAKVDTVTRTLWRLGRNHIVVCDTLVGSPDSSVLYHWHGDAEAYWGESAGAVSLVLDSADQALWIQSGQQSLSLAQQHRLRGSRGQCTLKVEQPQGVVYHWWAFSFADNAPVFQASGAEARIGDFRLRLADLLPASLLPAGLEVIVQSHKLQVSIRRGDEFLGASTQGDWHVSLSVNAEEKFQQKVFGRCWSLPIPAITTDDQVVLLATPVNGSDTHGLITIERHLTLTEKKSYVQYSASCVQRKKRRSDQGPL